MRIVQITPGAGGMYCGNCFRDNALVAALRRMGHSTLMVPLYLPLTLDEPDESAGMPIFFSGLNVYLEQKSAWFRRAPKWLHHLLASPVLLRWAAGSAARTQPEALGDMTVSMLEGEQGRQARELDELLGWFEGTARPDVICLSNALLLGLARRLKSRLGARLVCMLQGEDTFLDALPEPHRTAAWRTARERAREIDLFIAPSRYFAELMEARLEIDQSRLTIVHNGISLEGYPETSPAATQPAIGYFARMCREKGLHLLIEAYIRLRERGRTGSPLLRVGGACGPADRLFVEELQRRLAEKGLAADVSFHPNLDRAAKIQFLQSLTVFSVPALYSEAFGLYLLEALATGVPVAQPRHAAFPELVEATGGGLLCEPNDADSLAAAIETLLLDPNRARALGRAGKASVRERFSIERMARDFVNALGPVWDRTHPIPEASRAS